MLLGWLVVTTYEVSKNFIDTEEFMQLKKNEEFHSKNTLRNFREKNVLLVTVD